MAEPGLELQPLSSHLPMTCEQSCWESQEGKFPGHSHPQSSVFSTLVGPGGGEVAAAAQPASSCFDFLGPAARLSPDVGVQCETWGQTAMGSDYSPPQPDLRQPASVCALGLSFPASDVEMMVPTSQGWGVDSGRSGKESAGGRKWTLGAFSHFSL